MVYPARLGFRKPGNSQTMGLYYQIALRAFRRATIYRSAMIAGMVTNAFFGVIRCFVFLALYRDGQTMAGFSEHQAVSYTWVTQSLISVGGAWVSRDLIYTIRSGDVAVDLYRPWSFYGYWLSRTLGSQFYNLMVRGFFTYAIGILLFHAYVPQPAELAAFLLTVMLAMLISFAFGFMVNSTAFWILESSGLVMVANIIMMFFSGFLLPLSFFPPLLKAIADLLPFRAVTSVPALTVLGMLKGEALAHALLLQLFWIVAMTAAALAMLKTVERKLVVQGG